MSADHQPIILCIETSTDVCSVALSQGSALLSEEIDRAGGRRHAALLPTMIDPVLDRASLSLSQIDAVAYSNGPGSYTGLRVGLSTAKGICLGLEKPLLAISTLLALTHSIGIMDPGSLIVSMIDAGRDEVYLSGFDADRVALLPPQPMILSSRTFVPWLEYAGHIYIVGDGASKAKNIFEEHSQLSFGPFEVLANQLIIPAYDGFVNKNFENLAYSVPFYLKAPAYVKSI